MKLMLFLCILAEIPSESFAQHLRSKGYHPFSNSILISLDGGSSFNNTDYVETNFNYLIKGGFEYFLPSRARSALGFRIFSGGGLISGQNIPGLPDLPQKYETKLLFWGGGLVYSYATRSFISPYIFIGLSHLSFNPLDENGNKMPRNADNMYDTKELNYNGEIGLRFLLSDYLSLNLSTAIYLSANDNLDDLPNEISGGRQNDKFFSVSAGLSLILNASSDSDNDGVDDDDDLCPNTPENVNVNEFGCPPDSDNDGIFDYEDLCDSTPRGIPVDEDGCPLDTDSDGVPDYLDSCPDTPEMADVDNKGCPVDTDADGIPDYIDECPDTTPGEPVDKKGCPKVEEIPVPELKTHEVGKIINFNFGKAELTPFAKTILKAISQRILKNPETIYAVSGYTDNSRDFNYNRNLSKKRAEEAHSYLLSLGVPASRLRIFANGSASPLANNDLEFGRTLNNRVEIERIGMESEDPKIKILKDADYDFQNESNIESTIFSDGKFYCIQVSSWQTKQKALSESKKLNSSGYQSFVISAAPDHKSGTWYRVRIGYFNSIEATKEYLRLFE